MFGILKGNIHILTNDQTMGEALSTSRIIKSKRQPPNLKKILTNAKFAEQASRTSHKVFKCNSANCALCDYLAEGHSFSFKGKIFSVKKTMSCDVKNIFYVLQCNGCNEYYIGQTGDKLRSRRTVHVQQIRDHSTRQVMSSLEI